MWAATALLIVLVAVAGFVALQAVAVGQVGLGVAVAGVSLKGGPREAAATGRRRARRAARAGPPRDRGRPSRTLSPQLGITHRRRGHRARALDAGWRGCRSASASGCPVAADVAPVVRVDETRLHEGPRGGARRRSTCRPATRASSSPVSASSSSRPEDGREVDAVALERALLAAVEAGRPYDGPVPTAVVPPEVTTVDAEARASAARRLPRAPGHAPATLQGR